MVTAQIIGQFVDGALSGKGAKDVGVEQSSFSRIVRDHGATFRLLHPDTIDPVLRRYFVVDVHQDSSAEALAEELRTVASVDGAYVKPSDEVPSDVP